MPLLNADAALFQTGWFIESMTTQILVVFCIRTRRWAFQSRPSRFLVGLSLSAVAVAVGFTLLPLGHWFGFVTPPLILFAFLIPVTVGYLAIVEVAKIAFFRYAVRH